MGERGSITCTVCGAKIRIPRKCKHSYVMCQGCRFSIPIRDDVAKAGVKSEGLLGWLSVLIWGE